MKEPNGLSPYDEALMLAILIVGVFVIAAITGCSGSGHSVNRTAPIGQQPMWECVRDVPFTTMDETIAQCQTPEECNKICATARGGGGQ
jgi:hypothetical protein